PFWYLLVSPLAWLPLTTGAVIWTWLMAAALVGTLWLLQRWARDAGTLRREDGCQRAITDRSPAAQGRTGMGARAAVIIFAVALVFYAPLIESLGSGQKGTLLLLLFTA